MRKISLLTFLIVTFSQVYGQGFSWGRVNGSTGNDYARGVFIDGAGSVYTVGSFSGTVDFDPGAGVSNLTATGVTDAYIQKLNSAGVFQFARRIGGAGDAVAYGISVDPNNLIYITGSFTGTVDLDPGAGAVNVTSAGGTDVFLVRLTTAGNWSYSSKFGSTGADVGLSVCANSGAFAITGTFENTVDFDPGAGVSNITAFTTTGFLARYVTGAGAFTFATVLGVAGTASQMDASGNIYATGSIGSIVNVGGVNLTSAGSTDAFVCKIGPSGTNIWSKALGGTTGDAGFGITTDASGNVYTTGYFSGTADFDPGASSATITSGGSNDGYVSKLDVNGDYVWSAGFSGTGDDRGLALDVDPSGNVYTIGYFRNTVDFDPGAGVANEISAGLTDGFVSKLDAAGQYVWSEKVGSTGNDAITGVTVDPSNNIHFVGYLSGTVDVNPTATTTNLVSAGGTDGMVVKWAPCVTPSAPSDITLQEDHYVCSGNSTALTGSGSGTLGWYTASSGGTYLGGGTTYNTGTLTTTTNFYLQDSSCIAGPRTQITVYVSPAITIQTISAASSTVCSGGSTTIDLSGSESGVSYYLRDDSDNSIIAGPISGTGSAISIPTGAISVNTTYNVLATSVPVNYALDLDGVNDYVNMGNSNRGVTNVITISARVRASVTGANQFIAYKYDGSTTGYLLYIDAAGKARFDGRDGSGGYKSSGVSTTIVANNQWHEVTGVVTNTGWQIYVDGVLENSGAYTLGGGGLATANNLMLGTNATLYSAMDIDRFSIWSASLTAPEILAFVNTCLIGDEANLTTYLPMNEGSGSTVNDFSVTAINGTLTNMSVPACWISGSSETCLLGCDLEMSNTVTVSVNAAPATPTITAGGPTALCSGGSVTLTSSAGTSYLWSTGETTASIIVSTAGTYTVQVTNAAGCQSAASAGTTVTVGTPPATPSITAGGPTTFCAGGSVTLTSSAGTSYLWSNGATTASISPTTSGTYTVQVTNAAGCQSAASAGTTVTVNALPSTPTITAGGPTTFCAGGSVTLTSSAGTSYLWSNGATTASISPTTAGTYSVQVTNAAGCQSAASTGTTVTVNALPSTPTITAGGPTTFCVGGSVTLTSSAGTSYLWSNGATTASISPTTSGTYSVQVTNAAGCQSAASAGTPVTVNALPSTPTITAGGPTTFCAGGSVTLTSSAGTSYLWSNGATTASISPTTAGTYSVQVTNAAGCQSAASTGTTVTVNALPAQPTITAGGPTTFCQGGSVTLTSTSGSSYLWTGGSTSSSINPSSSGTFTVQVTNAAGCQSIASAPVTVTVNSLPNAPIISPNGPTTFCDGGTVNLASSAGITYLWSNGSTAAAIDITNSGTFTVQITGSNGCQSPASSPVTVTVNSIPVITQGTTSNPTSCTVDNGSIEVNGSGTGTLSWSGTTSGSQAVSTFPTSITNLGDGTYVVTFSDANACESAPLNISLSAPAAPAAPTVTAGGTTTFCAGESVTLTASAGTTYLWSNGATTASINVSTAGNYSVSITDASGCSSPSSAATSVTVNALPVITTGTVSDPTSCITADGSIEVSGTGTGDLSWTGATSGSSNGATLPATIPNLGQGNYTFSFTDANGCISEELTVTLTAPGAPSAPTVTANGPVTFCEGGSVTLTASAATSYLWSNGETTQSIDVTGDGTFSVIITDANGCTSPSSTNTTVTVDVMPDLSVTMSNNVITATQSGATYQWIDCSDNSAIAGETAQTFAPTTNGNYAVVITSGTCSDTSVCTAITTIGLDEIHAFQLSVNPNPGTDLVQVNSNGTIQEIAIYTATGELVRTVEQTQFTIRDLARGMYLLRVTTTEGIGTLRLIKE